MKLLFSFRHKFLPGALLLLAFLSLLQQSGSAQKASSLGVVLLPARTITLEAGREDSLETLLTGDSLDYYYRFVFKVSDTTTIGRIYTRIGTSADSSGTLMEGWHDFDQPFTLEGAQGYSRDRYQVNVLAGMLGYRPKLYCEVALENLNNEKSPSAYFILEW